jgi:hypothetical protein
MGMQVMRQGSHQEYVQHHNEFYMLQCTGQHFHHLLPPEHPDILKTNVKIPLVQTFAWTLKNKNIADIHILFFNIGKNINVYILKVTNAKVWKVENDQYLSNALRHLSRN